MKMKAYTVWYETAETSGFSEVVLVDSEEQVEESLSEKVVDYELGNRYCKITNQEETPISTVKISHLSITEFKKFLTS
jgi:hypothetical protein